MTETKQPWGEYDDSAYRFLENDSGTFQFRIKAAIDSAAIGAPYFEKYGKDAPRALRFLAEVISEGDDKGKLLSFRFKLNVENKSSSDYLRKILDKIFNVRIGGSDRDASLDMSAFIGRVFMAQPSSYNIGDAEHPKKVVVLYSFVDGKDYGSFIYDENIISQNEAVVIEHGSDETSEQFWDAVLEAQKKRDEYKKDSGGNGGNGGGSDSGEIDDDPLPF